MKTTCYLSTELSCELQGAEFGDKRLNKRLGKIVDAVSTRPSEGLPDAVGSTAALEGLYRFLRNEKVEHDKILTPHFEQTTQRCIEAKNVLIISDTSIFCFAVDPKNPKTKREGLGPITRDKQGFFSHFALAVSQAEAMPLGVLGLETFVRTGKKGKRSCKEAQTDPSRESCKWLRVAEGVDKRIAGKANAIHLADREADFYEFLNYFVDNNQKCIVRVQYNRRLHPDEEVRLMNEKLQSLDSVYEREVPLSPRKVTRLKENSSSHPARGYRLANLSFSACPVELICSKHLQGKCNDSLKLNLVHVQELNCSENNEPIDWKLLTTEAIETTEQIVQIVDNYRKRWTIEEYFKALKSGCLYEERQLESLDTLLNALAIFIPVAWKLLLMRSLAKTKPDESACLVLTKIQIEIMKACSKRKLPEINTVKDALYAVAGMGGHIRNNGTPGWQVLGRGYQRLLMYEVGWLAAMERCDLS